MGNLAEELMAELECETAFTIPVFGGLAIPESVAVTWLIVAVLVIVSALLTRNLKVVPATKRQIFVEFCVDKAEGFFGEILGEHGKRYIPYLIAAVLYIGCANLIGLFGLKPPTKDLNVTAGLAIMSIMLIEYAGLHKKGAKGFLKSFAQPMAVITPINILEIIIKPLSLCMRLFGNVLGAFVVMELIKIIMPAFLPIPFSIYFDIFDGLIQAYVFVFLTSLFMKESME
ncbi:F0F1 ATP synthase subunit A [Blautia schinkii]|nr:F0F1 ATP synthase subunit A [Blautia schinkii]